MILEAEHETLESKDGDLIRCRVMIWLYRLPPNLVSCTMPHWRHNWPGRRFQFWWTLCISRTRTFRNLDKCYGSRGVPLAVAAKLKPDYADIFPRDASLRAEGRGNFLSRERFDRRAPLDHQRRLSEEL
jgi:hypothetical protein